MEADTKNLEQVISFINTELERKQCSDKIRYEIDIAVEEIYVNIASYAYSPETGMAWIRCDTEEQPQQIVIQFLDSGRPYNPLERPDPDVDLCLEERQTGGLGIYLVKQSMTSVDYEYRGGKNIFTIRKELDRN